MIDFSDNLTLTFTGSGNAIRENPLWIRTQVFNKRLGLEDHEYFVFQIPEHEPTDGASIPRLVWWLIAPFDWRILIPSQPHDHCYRIEQKQLLGYIWDKRTSKISSQVLIDFTRKEADLMLPEKMRSYGCGILLRSIVYLAVRLGGYKSFYT